MKSIIYFFIVLTILFLINRKIVLANLVPEGVLAGPEKTYTFIKDIKTGQVKMRRVQFTHFTDLATGRKFVAECPLGSNTCESATAGMMSLQKQPFRPIQHVACKKITIKNGKPICAEEGEKADMIGDKKMDFVPKEEEWTPEQQKKFEDAVDQFIDYGASGERDTMPPLPEDIISRYCGRTTLDPRCQTS